MKVTLEQLKPIPDPTIEPGQAELTTDIGGHPFVIRGPEEAVYAEAQAVLQAQKHKVSVPIAHKAVEAAVAIPEPQSQYLNLSELPSRQIARMKLKSWFYDKRYGTQMRDLLQDRINDDRDVAFAQKLGLIGTTHCQKHAKAVSKLRGLTQ